MKTGWTKKWLCLACLSLLVVFSAVGTGQTAGEPDQRSAGSIVDRVKREDDPELSELIRIALTNRKGASEQERFEIIRKVTQSYAQIKLLDQQIEQLGHKIEITTGPAEMRSEFVLAQAELVSKRSMELANLREIMGIIPRFPFDKQPTGDLNTWLNLQVLEQRVVVYDALKPFQDYWAMWRHKVAGVLSEKETLDYLRGRLKDKKNLPMRIDIEYRAETRSAGERLRGAVFSLAKETGADMDVEVRLELIWWISPTSEAPFFCREGKIRTLYGAPMARPDGGPQLFRTGLVDPNDLEQHILWRLLYPGNVPIRLRVEYDPASTPIAKQVAASIKSMAQRLGVAELVTVKSVPVEPVPETAFLGRWEALGKGYIQALDIQPQGVCQVAMGDGTQAFKAGASVKGTWMPTCKEILIDFNDELQNGPHFYYLASLNEKGNLVVDRTEVYKQGYFSVHNTGQMIFQKVK
ncbi:MAG: hypothetical protein M1376_22475 [Planctomycetes bacterium]|nr:hypothetical protein [Planctomycetota bacterium]